MTDKTSFGPAGQTSKFPVVEFSLVIQHNSVHEFAAAPCSGAEGGGSSGTGSHGWGPFEFPHSTTSVDVWIHPATLLL